MPIRSAFRFPSTPLARKALAGAGLIIAGLAGGTPSAWAQSWYPMVCRAGGDMTLAVQGDHRLNATLLWLRFDHGSRAYSRATLAPGQCTWRDRGPSRTEPNLLLFKTRASLYTEFDAIGSSDPINFVSGSNADPDALVARNFLAAVRTPGLFTMMVRNEGTGFLAIQSIRQGD